MEQTKKIEFTVSYPAEVGLPTEVSRHDVVLRPLSRPCADGLGSEAGISFAVLGCGSKGSGPDLWGVTARDLQAHQVAACFKRFNGKPLYNSARWV